MQKDCHGHVFLCLNYMSSRRCLCVQSYWLLCLPLQDGTPLLHVLLFKHLISDAPWRTKPVSQVYLTLLPTEKSLPYFSPFLGSSGLLHSLDTSKRYVRVTKNILEPVLTIEVIVDKAEGRISYHLVEIESELSNCFSRILLVIYFK